MSASSSSAVGSHKYVSLTTYRRNGESSAVPVWIVDLGDGTVGFTTGPSSLKAKRIRHDGRVHLQACDSRGRLTEGSEQVDGTARVIEPSDTAGVAPVRDKVKAKYGMAFRAIMAVNGLKALVGRGDKEQCAIAIDLAD